MIDANIGSCQTSSIRIWGWILLWGIK